MKRMIFGLILAALAFAGFLAFWHLPAPYAATFLSASVYWTMHLTLLGSAVWLWTELLNGRPTGSVAAAAAISMIQMGLVGTGGVDLRFPASGFQATMRAPLVQLQQS